MYIVAWCVVRGAFSPSSIHHILFKSFLHHILLFKSVFNLFQGLFLSFGYSHYSRGSPDRISPETLSYSVHCQIEADFFRGIVKHIELLDASYHVAEPYANEPYKHSSLVEFCKEFLGDISEYMVERCVWYTFLECVGIEV